MKSDDTPVREKSQCSDERIVEIVRSILIGLHVSRLIAKELVRELRARKIHLRYAGYYIGVGSILNLAGNYYASPFRRGRDAGADAKALTSDWTIIGDDLRAVILAAIKDRERVTRFALKKADTKHPPHE